MTVNVNDKVMEILKADKRANMMMKLFEEQAVAEGLSGETYEEARKTMLMLIITKTPKALEAMAEELYEEIRG